MFLCRWPMPAPRNDGELVMGPRDALTLCDLSEELADGLAPVGSYALGDPIPVEAWRPLARSAGRLATLLEGLAAQRAGSWLPAPSIH